MPACAAEEAGPLIERVGELSLLIELHRALDGASDLAEILNLAVQKIRSCLPFPAATTTILLLNSQKDRLYLEAGVGLDTQQMGKYVLRSTDVDARHFEKLFGRKEPLLIPDLTSAPEVSRLLIRKDLKSFFVFPLADKEEILGLLTISTQEPCSPPARVVRLVAEMTQALVLHFHQIHLLESLRTQLEQLKRVNRTKSEFIANASHELKTPLTSLRGAVELLCDPEVPKTPENQARLAEIALSNADYLSRLINDMLDLSRLDIGTVRLEREPVPVDEIVEEVASSFTGLAQERGLSISAERPAAPLVVKADRDGLRRVLVNLVDNAIKFSTPGGTIALTVRDAGKEILVCVADTGIGIDPADQERIFEEYVQLGTVRHRGGTGLGLAIVKGIVEAHHGKVGVESRVGEGSRFYFSLPKQW